MRPERFAVLGLLTVTLTVFECVVSSTETTEASASHDPAAARARIDSLLAGTPLIDGHNDLIIHFTSEDHTSFLGVDSYDISGLTRGQVDLPRLKEGKVAGGIFTVGILNAGDREAGIRESTTLMRALAARHGNTLEVVVDADGFVRAFAAGRIAALLGLEGGDQIGGSLEVLRAMHRHGVRAMTLIWENTNDIGDSNADSARFDGLSPFGVNVVREMNRLGIVVDLSHASDSTVADALDVSRVPVILSHSSARALCPAPRNVPDDLLRRIAAKGGLVMVTFVPYYTTSEHWAWYRRGEAHWAELKVRYGADGEAVRHGMVAWERENPAPVVALRDVADHIDHVRHVAGVEHVGIGADFDGMGPFRISGLEDVSTFPRLFEELAIRGWSDADLRKLAGENFLRVLRAAEMAAER